MDAGGEQALVTPLHPDALHNFGPASTRDTIVYTCERPGGDTSAGKKIPTVEKVREWKHFMSHPDRNIQRVIILLDEHELEDYEEPGLVEAYTAEGIKVHHIRFAAKNSFSEIMATLDEAVEEGEHIVAHCTHGMGRSGRVAAGWLVHKYGLSPEDASEEVLATARSCGVERMGAVQKLAQWIEIK